jgi:hypothetical protein
VRRVWTLWESQKNYAFAVYFRISKFYIAAYAADASFHPSLAFSPVVTYIHTHLNTIRFIIIVVVVALDLVVFYRNRFDGFALQLQCRT